MPPLALQDEVSLSLSLYIAETTRKDLIAELVAHDVHLVRIVSAAADPQDGSACVYVDDRDAAYEITEYLILVGHGRVGFLWGG